MSSQWSILKASTQANRTTNPLRDIVDQLDIQHSDEKPLIPLSLGDPSVFGNLPPSQTSVDAICEAVTSGGKLNGYPPSIGLASARKAVADKLSHPSSPLDENDIILASGCSGALEICISAMCNPGDNILIPQPGFSLYRTLAESHGVECRMYPLLPSRSWEADIDAADVLVDERTRLLIVNNPSNPCGSVYTKKHLLELICFAAEKHLPIIADEIYGDIVFTGHEFIPMATLTEEVPILAVGGLAKQYLVPGWRMGWIAIHDRNGLFVNISKALIKISQLILGPNSLVQAALPKILHETPSLFHDNTLRELEDNAAYCVERVQCIPALRVIVPQGAMYVMVQIDTSKFSNINDDMDFTQKLLSEEYVFVLPGSGFCAPNFFRIVFCAPKNILKTAFDRMQSFCERHHV